MHLFYFEDKSFLFLVKKFHEERFASIDRYLPFSYHPAVPCLLWIQSKCCIFVWIFGNLLVIVICRGLTKTLQVFHESLKNRLNFNVDNFVDGNTDLVDFSKLDADYLRDRYLDLRKLMESAGKFLGPLILTCYAMNIYYIIIKV